MNASDPTFRRTNIALSLSFALSVTAAVAFSQPVSAFQVIPGDRAPIIDNVEDDWVNRNPIPVRPMAAANGVIWAVNPYLSTVRSLSGGATPFQADPLVIRTLPGPVAIATYSPAGLTMRLVVVCQHANAVAVHDSITGDILRVIKTDAQPADIIVEPSGRTWVSCPAADTVLEFDLAVPAAPIRRYSPRCKQPTFLSSYVDPAPPGLTRVLVAPRVSGNGSLVTRKPDVLPGDGTSEFNDFAAPAGIVDSSDWAQGLPDEDLFWLNPADGSSHAVVRQSGTLLFAHAVRPGTFTVPGKGPELWQLNIDSLNVRARSEEEARELGVVSNRLTRVRLPNIGVTNEPELPSSHIVVNLDDAIPGPPDVDFYFTDGIPAIGNPAQAIGMPYALAFSPGGNNCYVAGLLTDNVLVLNDQGQRLGAQPLGLPPGTMPRGLLVQTISNLTYLYIWGTGGSTGTDDGQCSVFRIRTTPGATPVRATIGFDPTPPNIRAGRALFFDASFSEHNTVSCASCHDEGKTDMLAWNLSRVDRVTQDGPDNKGPMLTQTLVGIGKAMPFHWRGEQQRGLIDFNAAFEKLLGDRPTMDGGTLDAPGMNISNGEFARFEEYVLSLTEDANQFQHPSRLLNNTIVPPNLDTNGVVTTDVRATDGLLTFQANCVTCHSFPSGTNNDVVDNSFAAEDNPARLWLKIAPYQGMQFKGMQPQVDVLFPGTSATQRYPILGSGLAHAGVVRNVQVFLLNMLDTESAQERANVTSFIHQFDTGVAPATHQFFLMRGTSAEVNAVRAQVEQFLNAQAFDSSSVTDRNCDVAVLGRSVGTAIQGLQYNRSASTTSIHRFRRETNGLSDLTLAQMTSLAANGGWFVFIGMPVGTARRFAIDYDGDNAFNSSETVSSPFDPDTDNDGFWDLRELQAGTGPADAASVPSAPNDGDPPGLALNGSAVDPGSVQFQWTTQTTGRLTFETDELCTTELQLVGGNTVLPLIRNDTPKLQHNILLSNLQPGTTYDVTLTLTDRSGNGTGAQTFTTLADVVSKAVPPSTGITGTTAGDLARGFVVRELLVTRLAGPGVQLRVTGKIALNTGEPLSLPAGAPIRVMARVFINDTLATSIASGGVANFAVNGRQHPLPGPFITAVTPPTTGTATLDFTMDFTLTGLAIPSKVAVAIAAIGPLLPPVGLGPPNLLGRTPDPRFVSDPALRIASFWSLPDTTQETPTQGSRFYELEISTP